MSIECRIVEGDLRIQADQPFAPRKLWCRNNGERIHLNKIGIALTRDLHKAGCNRAELLEEFTAQADAEAESARLEGEQATVWVGNFANDRARILGGDLFDFHATGGRCHDEHPASGSVNQRSEIDLTDDG